MYATGIMGDNLEIRAHALDTSKKEFYESHIYCHQILRTIRKLHYN